MRYKDVDVNELRNDIPDLHGIPDAEIRFAIGMFCNGSSPIKLLGMRGCELMTHQQLRAIQKHHSVVRVRAEYAKQSALQIAMDNQSIGQAATETLVTISEDQLVDIDIRVDALKHLSRLGERATEIIAKYADTEEKAELRQIINAMSKIVGVKEI